MAVISTTIAIGCNKPMAIVFYEVVSISISNNFEHLLKGGSKNYHR